MTKEDILKNARAETQENRMDELEKHTFDRSFYWAFLAAAFAMIAFCLIRLARDEEIYDVVSIVAFSAFATSFYRFIKSHRSSYLFVALLNLGITVIFTYRFFNGK